MILPFHCFPAALEAGPKYLSINITEHKGKMRTTAFHHHLLQWKNWSDLLLSSDYKSASPSLELASSCCCCLCLSQVPTVGILCSVAYLMGSFFWGFDSVLRRETAFFKSLHLHPRKTLEIYNCCNYYPVFISYCVKFHVNFLNSCMKCRRIIRH